MLIKNNSAALYSVLTFGSLWRMRALPQAKDCKVLCNSPSSSHQTKTAIIKQIINISTIYNEKYIITLYIIN